MSQKQAIVCSNSKCGKSFTEPIKLTLIQPDGSLEIYDACPHCFSQVNLENRKVEETETSSDKLKKGLKKRAKGIEKAKPVGCAHFIGYLKTRPKGSPIPEECLTCPAILRCM